MDHFDFFRGCRDLTNMLVLGPWGGFEFSSIPGHNSDKYYRACSTTYRGCPGLAGGGMWGGNFKRAPALWGLDSVVYNAQGASQSISKVSRCCI